MTHHIFKKITIIGVGLLGGSLGLKCKLEGLADEIVGVGRGVKNLEDALALGAIDRFTRDPVEGVKGAHLVVLATPVGSFEDRLKEISSELGDGTVVTDLGSVKGALVEKLEKLTPPGCAFVGGHPIAGKEKTGAMNSDAELFQGAKCVLTPTENTDGKALSRVAHLWERVGATVTYMDPYEHDAVLAAASHLPQLAASSLVTAFQELSRSTPQALNFFGGGFRDTTRVASSAPEMWRDICLYNREQILKALDQLREAIDTARARIASGDGGELLAFFEGAKAFRDMLMADGPGNGGQAPQGLTITIDGTAGAGKSTIAKLLSRRLGYKYIDTGAIYRTVALCAVEEGIPLNDEDGLTALCRRIKIDQRLMDGELRVFCRDRDITERIRSPEMGMNASIVSAHPRVREELLGAQREMARGGRVVAEGRDVGSVVLPGADIKIYLDASLEVRAKRRYLQAGGEESKFNLEKTIDSIKKRDEQDKGRAVSPLKIPSNAVVIDSGETDVQETLNEILSLLKKRFPDIVHPVIKDIIN